MEINIGDFVIIHHPYSWRNAHEDKMLCEWELKNEGYLKGQVVGTYGPWEHMPESKFHWSIVPDCWVLSEHGSCQLEEDRVKKDVARSRQWWLSLLTKDFSTYTNSNDDMEYIIEKAIIEQNRVNFLRLYDNDTSGEGRYPVPV